MIVTANLRDFPTSALSFFEIEALHPDAFIEGLFQFSSIDVAEALRELREDMRKPPMTAAGLLAEMARQGLTASANALATYRDAL